MDSREATILGAGIFLLSLLVIPSLLQGTYAVCSRTVNGVSMQDLDCDKLPDSWEDIGIRDPLQSTDPTAPMLLNLPGLGADKNQKDIFVEIDYSGYHIPINQAKLDVQNAFLAAPVWNPPGGSGVEVHFLPSPASQDIQSLIGQEVCLNGWPGFSTIKNIRLGSASEQGASNYALIKQARDAATHYAVSIDTQCADPTSSGTGEIYGNDFIISLGGSGWGTDGSGHNVGSVAQQAAVIMHELGHNLNLRHGGNVDVNCKPNYLSVMSYNFQFPTFVSGRPLDFSRSTLNSLNEAALNENTGIIWSTPTGLRSAYGPPAVLVTQPLSFSTNPINWNRDTTPANTTDTGVTANVNNLGITDCNYSTMSTLYGYYDWANLIFWGDGVNFGNYGGIDNETSERGEFSDASTEENLSVANLTETPLNNNNSAVTEINRTALLDTEINGTSLIGSEINGALLADVNSTYPANLSDIINPLVSEARPLPKCDLQDPACVIPVCDPLSPRCLVTQCDPSDENCKERPVENSGIASKEFTTRDLHDSRQRAVETLDSIIHNLPNDDFTDPTPANVGNEKAQLRTDFINSPSSVKSLAMSDNMEGQAIIKLNDIREKLVGTAVGPPVLKPTPHRTDVIWLLDNLITSLEKTK